MIVSVEISLYPIGSDIDKPISDFIAMISMNENFEVDVGKMSTTISGEYSEIIEILSKSMKDVFDSHPAVFNFKISNCCSV